MHACMVFVCFFELGNRHGGLVGWLEDGRQCSKCSSVSRIKWYGGATSLIFAVMHVLCFVKL